MSSYVRPLAKMILSAILLAGCTPPASEHLIPFPDKDDPIVSLRLWIKTGSQCDPTGREGLAALTAAMLTRASTKVHSYSEILDLLYPMATSYQATVDKEMTVITARVHVDNLEEFYPLLINAVLHPALLEDDFRRIRTDMINAIEKGLRYSDDEELGKAALHTFVFEDTPYAHPVVGRVASLKKITVDDVRSFYKRWYTGDNIVIGIAGGYDDALIERLQLDIAKLPVGAPTPPGMPAPNEIQGLQFLLVEKDCKATSISMGVPIDVLRGQDDFWPLFLFNSWFGEHRNSSSHLYQVLREAQGMNYGAYSYIEFFPNGGHTHMPTPNHARRQQLFEIWLRPVRHEHRHFALRAALRELQMAVDSGMTQEQLDLTKRFLDKYVRHYAKTAFDRLGYAMDSRFYGLRGDYLDVLRKRLRRVSLDEVNTAIRTYLQPANLKIAVVTKGARAFADSLVTDAPSPVIYDAPKSVKVIEDDAFIQVYPLAVRRENIRIVPVGQMFR
ncbi:MAG: insulinase family protein [Bacteroidia bacterium]|nr:insulinase family protein [Bacteroidia bacterium]